MSEPRKKSISVFFPAYNDEEAIAQLVTDVSDVLVNLTDDYEIIVVNDGSTDGTRAVLDELERTRPRVRAIHHAHNLGYGAALRTGFRSATKDLIFYTDGDGQYDVHELARLHPLMRDGIDIVNGFKIQRADGFERRLIGSAYNRLARFFFRLPISDVDCDFRLIRRKAVQQLDLVSSSGVICVELVRRLHAAGCVFAEVPVHHYPRQYGRSQFFRFNRVARTAFDFFFLWLRLVVLSARR